MPLATTSPEFAAVGLTILVLLLGSLLALAPLRKLRLPFTVALMLLGCGAGALVNAFGAHAHGPLGEVLGLFASGAGLTPEVILFVFLPPLVYESAYNLDARALFQNMPAIMTLAVPALILSTAVTGAVVMLAGGAAHGLTWPAALLFGALISATDPVAVVALFKELGAPKRLGVLVEGESLLNDGTAIVLFHILLALVVAGVGGGGPELSLGAEVWGGVVRFCVVALGGVLVGLLLAWPAFALIGWVVSNEPVEISLSVVVAYASFAIAEHFLHVSGVLAAVTAGLIAGSYGRTKVSPSVQEFMHAFWEYMAFAMNTMIFFSVGLIIVRKVSLIEIERLLPLFAATVLAVIVARALGVFGSVPFLNRLFTTISLRYQTVMWWGGLRGAVSLALALTVFAYVDVPQPGGGVVSLPSDLRDTILLLTAGVVLFTLLVNAITMSPLIQRLGLDAPTPLDRFAEAFAERERLRGVARTLDRLEQEGGLVPRVLEAQRERLAARNQACEEGLERLQVELSGEGRDSEAAQVSARVALGVERGDILHRFASGQLGEAATRALLAEVDHLQDLTKQGQPLPQARDRQRASGLEARLLGHLEPWPLLGALARRVWARRLAVAVEAARGLYLVTRTVERTLAEIEEEGILPRLALAEVQLTYSRWRFQAEARLSRLSAEFPDYAQSSQTRLTELQLVREEIHALEHLVEAGLLTDKARARGREELREREEQVRDLSAVGLELDPQSLLRQVPAFRTLDAAHLESVAARLVSRTFLEGEVVVAEGSPGDSMFLIARGCVEVVTGGQGETPSPEVSLSTLSAGAAFGELALLLGGPRRATVRALSPVNLLELPQSALHELFSESEEFAEVVRASIYPRAVGRGLVDCQALAPLDASQRQALAEAFAAEEELAAGEVALDPREGARLCYVCTGSLRSGERSVAPGEIVGVESLLDDQGEPWVAAEPSRVLHLTPAEWRRFREEHPATADACRRAAASR